MPLQKPNSKMTAIMNDAIGWGVDRIARGMQKIFGLQDDWQHHLSMAKNNYELGTLYLSRGEYGNAIFRLKVATWVNPKHSQAWYQLGRAYLGEGKKPAAATAFAKASELMPESEEMRYMMAVLGGNKTPAAKLPKRMPPSLCLEHFELLAEGYNDEQLRVYGYKGHLLLNDAVRPWLTEGRLDHEVLDLGTGTGLCGARLRDVASRIIGVDFSAKMLAQAMQIQNGQGRKIFDELIQRDADNYLQSGGLERYDIVLAGLLISYIGDVQALFQHITPVLKKGGIFAFTADKCDGQDYRFIPDSGRFGFTRPHLESLVAGAGMEVVSFIDAEIYPGYYAWLCVARK